MPKYTVTVRGGLLSDKKLVPTGAVVELSEAAALSLPPGTVELALEKPVEKASTPKPSPKKEG